MLNYIELQFFKCFKTLRLPLAPLTLLTGLNASGKSSVLQAIVLLHQTMRESEWSTRLMLNGTSLRLGSTPDVVDELYGRKSFGLSLEDGGNRCEWSFSGDRRDMSMHVDHVAVNGKRVDCPATLRYMLPGSDKIDLSSLATRLRDLTYITAERLPPQEAYSLEDRHVVNTVGPRGEYTMSVLHWGRDEPVVADLRLPDLPAGRLRQVEGRMRDLFPGLTLDLQQIVRANSVTLGLRISDETRFHSPIQTGFGLTQVLPIVVAGLSSPRDSIIIIENPEVHLHPAGQAALGAFTAEIARAGIQVLLETHSDHVLSGVRRAVKDGCIASNQVALHFFQPRSEDRPQVLSPTIDKAGNIDYWPEGFFDQFDKDANYFAGW